VISRSARRVLSRATPMPSAAAEMDMAARSNEGRGRPGKGSAFNANQFDHLTGLS
jgi:hypothetical protein